jgi:hypothetical protein
VSMIGDELALEPRIDPDSPMSRHAHPAREIRKRAEDPTGVLARCERLTDSGIN